MILTYTEILCIKIIVVFWLCCIKIRMLDRDQWRSRIWRSFSQIGNSASVSSGLHQRPRVRCHWLESEYCSAVLLDSDIDLHRRCHWNWSYYSLRTKQRLSELIIGLRASFLEGNEAIHAGKIFAQRLKKAANLTWSYSMLSTCWKLKLFTVYSQ